MTHCKLKPAKGLMVRMPDGSLLPDAGKRVRLDTFWRRRIKFGDVEIVAEKPTKKPKSGGE